ncbi:MAG: sensor histidine kinase, partial [Bacteroidota bacterium]
GLYVCFFLLGGWLWWHHRRQGQPTFNWLNRLQLPWVGAGVALLFSAGLTLTSNYFQVAVAGASTATTIGIYLLVALQVFLVYYSYYLIYHVHHHVLFRRVLPERGLIAYLLGAILFILTFTIIHGWLISFLPAVQDYYVHPVAISGKIVHDLTLSLSLVVFLLSLPFILVVEWSRKERTLSQLQAEKAASELALLKEQINPHFFFNTLNNLYAMSLTQEAATPATILKLSGLMRFVIYKGREERVRLKEEVAYLDDYLDLQSIRLQKEADLKFTTEITDDNLPIAPMLLIILLENAFKHGIEPAEDACFLHVNLSTTENSLSFTCHNSQPPNLPETPPGIGLANLRRRLELLYPQQHTLNIQSSETDYLATLILEL